MNLSIIPAAFDVLRKGEAVANPAAWKVGGMALSGAVGALALSINSLAKAAGYDLNIDQPTADAIGAVAAWIVGCVFHVASTDKLGLPARPVAPSVAGPAGNAIASGDAHPPAPVGGQPAEPITPDPMRNDAFNQPNAGG